jgi:hypothetical protein
VRVMRYTSGSRFESSCTLRLCGSPLKFAVSVGLNALKLLNAELNPVRHLLTLAGARHFVDVSRIRVKRFLRHFILKNFMRNFLPSALVFFLVRLDRF